MNNVEEIVLSLQQEIVEYKKENAYLRAEIAQLKRLIFGKKSERFISEEKPFPPGTLFSEVVPEENKLENLTEQISYERTKPVHRNGGRKELPSHLLRQIEVIEPEDKKDTDRRIGLLVTEELEYTPGVFHVNRIERPKYVDDQTKKIKIAPMPSKPVPKSQFGPQFMAHTIVSKYMDHMPLYRMIQQFKRDHNVAISKSSLGESMHQYLDLLIPVYNKLKAAVLEQEYIQTDETTYKVLSEDKEGSAHLGYIWASYAPVNKLVLFTYQKSRSSESMNNHLNGFVGKNQVDGYGPYEKLQQIPGMQMFSCWAHARRKFDKALESYKPEAEKTLSLIQELYNVEKHCRDQNLNYEQRRKIRQDQSKVILQKIKSYLDNLSIQNILPASSLGEAIGYTLKRWRQLSNYIDHGEVEIDNNLIENKIRPIALGRKNYLFAGSHESAQRAAMVYSLFATCILHNINPYEWLIDVFNRINDHPINRIEELLPQNWAK